MLNPSFRNPAVLAKMLATLDQITHGRVICTLGAGWFQDEYTAYDVPFLEDHDERIAQEREVAQLLVQLWTHPAPQRTTFEGRYVRVRDLAFNPSARPAAAPADLDRRQLAHDAGAGQGARQRLGAAVGGRRSKTRLRRPGLPPTGPHGRSRSWPA